MLVLSRKTTRMCKGCPEFNGHDTIVIKYKDIEIEVSLVEFQGNQIKVGIKAPSEVNIRRKELVDNR